MREWVGEVGRAQWTKDEATWKMKLSLTDNKAKVGKSCHIQPLNFSEKWRWLHIYK